MARRRLTWSAIVKPGVLGLAALVLGLALRIFDPGVLAPIRLLVFDTYQELYPRPYEPAPVRVVDIDDGSLAVHGQWPWPRDLMAELVARLGNAGAAVVALDIIVAEPDRSSPVRVIESWRSNPRLTGLTQQFEVEGSTELPDNDAILADVIRQVPTVTAFALGQIGTDATPRLVAGLVNADSSGRET